MINLNISFKVNNILKYTYQRIIYLIDYLLDKYLEYIWY